MFNLPLCVTRIQMSSSQISSSLPFRLGVAARFVKNCTLSRLREERGANIAWRSKARLEPDGRPDVIFCGSAPPRPRISAGRSISARDTAAWTSLFPVGPCLPLFK
jgi:hypothetical protein